MDPITAWTRELDRLAAAMFWRAITWEVLSVLGFALVMYWVIRLAIRDGINDSQLTSRKPVRVILQDETAPMNDLRM